MRIDFHLAFLVILTSFLISLFANLYYNYDFLLIPKKHTFENVGNSTNTKVEEYKRNLSIECHRSSEDFIYCMFPQTDMRIFYPIGHSMMPYFQGNSEILLCNNNFILEEEGIYAFNYHDSEIPIVHRCIYLTPEGCIFKGDNNSGTENVTSEEVLCRVEWMVREEKK
jgi:hypothetical protein